jgi:hypothetical protein
VKNLGSKQGPCPLSLDETKSTGGLQTTQSGQGAAVRFDGHGSRSSKASGHCVFFPLCGKKRKLDAGA